MENHKLKYNRLLSRYRKAVEWIDAPERTEEEIDKHFPQYQKLLKDINSLIIKLEIQGDKETILNGFKEV